MDEVLARAGIFQGVEPAAAEALAQQLEPADFPRGHVIFAEGEPGDRLYILQSGKVKLGRKSPDGRENLLAIFSPADMFGELSIFDPGPRTATATTITDVRAYSMDKLALREWITKRPEIAEQLLRVLARRLRRTNNMLAELIFTDVPGRVLPNRGGPEYPDSCARPNWVMALYMAVDPAAVPISFSSARRLTGCLRPSPTVLSHHQTGAANSLACDVSIPILYHYIVGPRSRDGHRPIMR